MRKKGLFSDIGNFLGDGVSIQYLARRIVSKFLLSSEKGSLIPDSVVRYIMRLGGRHYNAGDEKLKLADAAGVTDVVKDRGATG